MGFADEVGGSNSSDFVGTGNNVNALYSMSDDLAAVPVRLKSFIGPLQPGKGAPPEANPKHYGEVVDMFAKMDPSLRAQYQQQLYEAGLYGAKDIYQPGEFDDVSEAAWGKLVDRAAKQGLSLAEVLETGKQGVNARGGLDSYYKTQRQAAQGPLVTKVTNPDDLRLTAQQVASKVMGRNFSEEELSKFIAAYQGTEQAAQRGVYGAQAGGGNVTAEASPEAAATKFAQSEHPTEFAAHKEVQVFDKIRQMLGGTISAAKPGTGGGTTGV